MAFVAFSAQSQDESRQQLREYEETKKQIEEDADREILDIKNKYERRLREEKEANLRLKGETGIMRKKVNLGLFVVWVNKRDHVYPVVQGRKVFFHSLPPPQFFYLTSTPLALFPRPSPPLVT